MGVGSSTLAVLPTRKDIMTRTPSSQPSYFTLKAQEAKCDLGEYNESSQKMNLKKNYNLSALI